MKNDQYECVISVDPSVVSRAFEVMAPIWQFLDPSAFEILRATKHEGGPGSTQEKYAYIVSSIWSNKPKMQWSGEAGATLLSRTKILDMFRAIEELATSEQLLPVISYWSTKDHAGLRPDDIEHLQSQCRCVTGFSEHRDDKPEEFSLWLESSKLCLMMYCHQRA